MLFWESEQVYVVLDCVNQICVFVPATPLRYKKPNLTEK